MPISPKHPVLLWIRALVGIALVKCGFATTYHVDPAGGSMNNPGTFAQPWSTLEAVFSANKTFAAGDEILLRSGYHGAATVKGNNSGAVTIRPADGADPKLRSLVVTSASNWIIDGLDVCPENLSPGTSSNTNTPIVDILNSTNQITLQNCLVRSAFNVTSWSRSQWDGRATRGIRTAGTYTTLKDNWIEGSTFGLTVLRTGSHAVISHNTVKGFSYDGMVGLADDSIYEYNTVTDAYINDNAHNHDDFFQSWSVGSDGFAPGLGTIKRVTLRGNTFISRTRSDQALPSNPQGIGLFDGYYEDWVIENNVIASATYHGIALYGAINCKIVNNTVVENPLDPAGGEFTPWIKISHHKNRSTPSSGNLVRNNITARAIEIEPGSSTVGHNQTSTNYTAYFNDHTNFDFSLKPGSPAIDAGSSEGAPSIDLAETPRSAPIDLGAYTSATTGMGQSYSQWLLDNDLPTNFQGLGHPSEDPMGDGVANEIKFALGLPVDSAGTEDRVTNGFVQEEGQTYLSLSYTRPEPAPYGPTYRVTGSGSLSGWLPGVEVSNVLNGDLRTITIRDTVPIGPTSPQRFIRFEVNEP